MFADASADQDAWRTALEEHQRGLLQQAREMTAEAAELAATLQDAAKQAEVQAAAAAFDALELLLDREVRLSGLWGPRSNTTLWFKCKTTASWYREYRRGANGY